MARLKNNEIELATFEYPWNTVKIFPNGKILKNQGNGWKVYSRVKKGMSAQSVVIARGENLEGLMQSEVYRRYRQLLTSIPLGTRHSLRCDILVGQGFKDPEKAYAEYTRFPSYVRKTIGFPVFQDICLLHNQLMEERKAK